jgi:hypothetical protein
MPGTAKQKRFMRLVKSRKSGHAVGGPQVQKAAASMQMSDVNDFVKGPTKPPVRSKAGMRSRSYK